MKLFQFINLLGLGIIFNLTACSASTPPPPTPTSISYLTQPTQVIGEIPNQPLQSAVTPTVALSPTVTPSPTPSPAPTATNTPVPTITPTLVPSPTLEPIPMVKVNKTLTAPINVRAGPNPNYPVVGQFQPGQEVRVTGRNEDTSWWQVNLGDDSDTLGWVFGQLVVLSGDDKTIPVVAVPPLPSPISTVAAESNNEGDSRPAEGDKPETPEELAARLRCGKDFCVTYQAMVPFWENGGCTGNHSIYITVLEGLPPGRPMDGIVLGDTFDNIEVVSGEKGPGTAEITLWMNSMSIKVKRNVNGAPYTSENSLPFTGLDELIPAEILAANGYCESNIEKCKFARTHNQVCRGHYSYRVTFHKFD